MIVNVGGSQVPIAIGQYAPGGCLTLNLSVTSASIQLNPRTHYRIWSSVNCFFDTGPTSGVTATTSTHPLTAGLDILHVTDGSNVWLAGIVATGTGVLYISPLNVTTN